MHPTVNILRLAQGTRAIVDHRIDVRLPDGLDWASGLRDIARRERQHAERLLERAYLLDRAAAQLDRY